MLNVLREVMQMFVHDTGFHLVNGKMLIMWAICGLLFYLAIKKQYEPLLLLPIAFGALMANLPTRALYDGGWTIDGMFHPTAGLYFSSARVSTWSCFRRSSFWGWGR